MQYNIHITDSYKVSKKDFEKVLQQHTLWWEVVVRRARSTRSLCREWAVHNFLYNLGIARERTKDVDLNYPQPIWERVGYFLMGWCRLFIE